MPLCIPCVSLVYRLRVFISSPNKKNMAMVCNGPHPLFVKDVGVSSCQLDRPRLVSGLTSRPARSQESRASPRLVSEAVGKHGEGFLSRPEVAKFGWKPPVATFDSENFSDL